MAGSLDKRLKEVHLDFQTSLKKTRNSHALQDLRVAFLGKKGHVTEMLKQIGTLTPEERPGFGEKINTLRVAIESQLEETKAQISKRELKARLEKEHIDVSLPASASSLGSLHPLTHVQSMMIDIFSSLGFSVEEGPDIESDYYNFEALNFPPNHPARDMQDTFFTKDGHVLRTHTSPVQIRAMETKAPPIRMVVPGRVYRHDADTTHSPVFHQVEGLCIGPNITFAHLKGTLEAFVEMMFGKGAQVRFRPSFFPFTEPSAELDVMGPNGQWMEILGCGMVDPAVFKHIEHTWTQRYPDQPNPYSEGQVTGFAFGMGVERIAMIKYGITDIKLFYENDLRFLEQFL